MDVDILRKLTGCFLTIWNDARKHNLAAPIDKSLVHEVFREEGTFRIGYDGIRAIKDALDILGNSELNKHYSPRYLNDEIERVIAQLISVSPQGIAKQTETVVSQWLSTLESSLDTDWVVIAPIANLILEMDSLQVGNVTFLKSGTSEAQSIIEQLNTIHAGTSSLPDVRHYMIGLTNGRFQNRVLAKVKVKAIDDRMAKGIGQETIEHALNVLRLYGFGVMKNSPLDYKMLMGIDGSVFSGKPVLATLKDRNVNLTFDTAGALYEYTFTPATIEQMDKLSFQYVSSMIKNEDKSDFEKLLDTSIDFFGAGMHDQDLIDSFVDFIISLESLVLKEREPSKGLLAERVALIIGQNSQQRTDIFEYLEYLYQLRLNIVHRGYNAITKENVKMISFYAFMVIMTLFLHTAKLRRIDDLVDMCEKLKFSGPTFGN